MIHTCLKHFYFNLKHINWHSFANLWCKAKVFSLNWSDVWSLFINHTLNASLKILNFNFFTLRQELKWLAKQSDWIISLDCYNLSLSPSQCSQPHLIQQFLYNFTGLLASNYSEELHLFFTKASLLVHSYFIDSIHLIYVKLICLHKIITIRTNVFGNKLSSLLENAGKFSSQSRSAAVS